MCRDKDTLADYGFDASHLELTTEMDRFSDSEDSTQEYALNDFQNGQAIEVEEDMAFHVDDFATAATIEVPIDIGCLRGVSRWFTPLARGPGYPEMSKSL